MKLTRCSFALAVCALATCPVLALSEVTTRVVNAGTYSNGNVYVLLEAVVDEAGCPRAAIELPANAVNAKTVLAAAFFAMSSGKSIAVRTNTCYLGIPSFDASVRNAYFGVAN